MSESNAPKTARDAGNWATPVDTMDVQGISAEAINLNVQGRKPMSPLQGFGQLWQKTYRIRLEGITVTPQEVIKEWKAHFPEFWPKGNEFYGPMAGVEPGEVAVLNLAMPGGAKLSTGIRVIYADDESFTFMTPQGHMFAGMNTFSAYDDAGVTVIQIQALVRAGDPIYEMSFRMKFGHKAEDAFWHDTLRNLAIRFGSPNREVTQTNICVDKKVQWSEAKNVWNNAFIRTALYTPVHMTKKLFKRA